MGNSSSNDSKPKLTAPKSPRKAKFLKYRKSFGAGSKAPSSERVSNSETLSTAASTITSNEQPSSAVPTEIRISTDSERVVNTFVPDPTGSLQAENSDGNNNDNDNYDGAGGRHYDDSTWFGLVYNTNSSSGGDDASSGETCKMEQQSCQTRATEADAECRRRFSRDTNESEATACVSNRSGLPQVSSAQCLKYVDESNLRGTISAVTSAEINVVSQNEDGVNCDPNRNIESIALPVATQYEEQTVDELLECVVIDLNAVTDRENCDEADSSFAGCGSDPLFTASATSVTPYYSPEEEFNVIFDFDMEAKTKIVTTSGSSSSASINGKENSVPNDREVIPKPNSFTVVKHKKVELSPTSFSTQKTSVADGKGNLPAASLLTFSPSHLASCKRTPLCFL